jgi:hypothetical protein
MSHGSFLHCDGLVTGETSVVYSPCIAVGLFSEQLTVTTDIASPLSGNGTVVPGILLHRQQPVTLYIYIYASHSLKFGNKRSHVNMS